MARAYVLAMILLLGATVNALRLALHERGSIERRVATTAAPPPSPAAQQA